MSFDNLAECEPQIPSDLVRHPEQPPDDIEWVTADSIFIKSMLLRKAGMVVPQHAHAYSHTSALVGGSIRVWCDGRHVGDFTAPKLLFIEKGTKHTFMSLEDNTTVLCLHNAMRPDVAAVMEEHDLIEEVA